MQKITHQIHQKNSASLIISMFVRGGLLVSLVDYKSLTHQKRKE